MATRVKVLVIDDYEKFCITYRRNLVEAQESIPCLDLEIEMIGPRTEEFSATQMNDKAKELIITDDVDYALLDWNIGSIGSSEGEDFYTKEIILLLLERKIPFRLISGSGETLREFITETAKDYPEIKDYFVFKGLHEIERDFIIPLREIMALKVATRFEVK